jgi:glycosyltransferase involved in cell wall biosynthesis
MARSNVPTAPVPAGATKTRTSDLALPALPLLPPTSPERDASGVVEERRQADGRPERDEAVRSATTRATARPRVCIVIPAFNEGNSVARVILRSQGALPDAHVVVVDDGSQDDTAGRAAGAGATVMSLPVNLGIGGAVQAGYLYALRHGFDIAMQIDGDGQHDPFEAERLLEPIVNGRADMTVGSRWLGRGDYVASNGRRFGMRLLARLVRWRTGGSFTDTTSGFRAVGRRGIEMFARNYPTDFPEVESLVLASRNRLRVEEVPVQMTPRAHGRSSIAGLRSAYYMMRVVVALIIDSLNRVDRVDRVDGKETP